MNDGKVPVSLLLFNEKYESTDNAVKVVGIVPMNAFELKERYFREVRLP